MLKNVTKSKFEEKTNLTQLKGHRYYLINIPTIFFILAFIDVTHLQFLYVCSPSWSPTTAILIVSLGPLATMARPAIVPAVIVSRSLISSFPIVCRALIIVLSRFTFALSFSLSLSLAFGLRQLCLCQSLRFPM